MARLRSALYASLFLGLTLVVASLVILRLRFILDPKRKKPIRHGRRNRHEPTHLLIVLGSGGHTAEMIAMLERAVTHPDPAMRLDWKDYTHRTWVVGSGDGISAQRARDFEDMAVTLSTQAGLMAGKVRRATDLGPGTYDIHVVPRAREIHQSLTTAPVSSVKCLLASFKVLMPDPATGRDFPDMILVNGPATATIMVLASIILRFFNYSGCITRFKMRTIYVESWARVKKLSLSGALLSSAVDRFLVQWPQLEKKAGKRAQYLGVLIQ